MKISNSIVNHIFNASTKPVEGVGLLKNNSNLSFKKDSVSFCSNMPLARKIDKYYRCGERHILNRINKLKPNELHLTQEAIDIIEKSKETDKPFETFSTYLQSDAGCEYIAVKKFKSPEGANVNLRIAFDKNFSPTLSRTECFDDKIVSWLKDGNKVLIDEIELDNTSCYVSKNKFEIINNEYGVPEKLIHTKPNIKYPNFYEITEYNFVDYDENIDLISEIKQGKIQDGKKLAWLEEKENEVIFYNEFSQNCTTTKRKYNLILGQDGEIVSQEYKYQIFDDLNNLVLNIDRKFAKNPDGSTTTIVGDKTYKATFDNHRKQTTIIDNLGNKKKYPCVAQAYEMYKNLPADIIIAMNKNWVRSIRIIDDAFDSSITPNGIGYDIKTAIDSYEALAHELGHAIDAQNPKFLLDNDDIKDMYNAEWEIFKENNPEQSAKILQYFSHKSPARPMRLPHHKQKSDGGLRELVAETYLLMNYFGFYQVNSKRALALVQNFPNTIALIAQNIETSTLI